MTTNIILENDQIDSVNNIYNAMKNGYRSILYRGETGSGKTIIATYIIKKALEKGSMCHFVVPRKTLLEQTHLTFSSYGIDHSFIASGMPHFPNAAMYICMAQTLSRKLDRVTPPQLAFIDETHYGGKDLERIVNFYRNAGTWLIGLSATPWKMNGKPLGDWYDIMVEGLSISELIMLKRLSEYKLYRPNVPDLSGIKKTGNGYAVGQLNSFMAQDNVIVGSAVKAYKERAMGKLNITFAVSIRECERIADEFTMAGVPSVPLHSKLDDKEIKKRIVAYANYEILNLVSCGLISFGFDLAAIAKKKVTIESMSDCDPTLSIAKQWQKNGRVLRYKDYPAIINDHVGNSLKFGLPCSPIEWSLNGDEKLTRKNLETEATYTSVCCPKCHFLHRRRPYCPECNYEYPIMGRKIKSVDGDLKEDIEAQKAEAERKRNQKRYFQLLQIARKRGYSNPNAWAKKKMKEVEEKKSYGSQGN